MIAGAFMGIPPKPPPQMATARLEQTGLITDSKVRYDRNRTMKYSDIAAEYNGRPIPLIIWKIWII